MSIDTWGSVCFWGFRGQSESEQTPLPNGTSTLDSLTELTVLMRLEEETGTAFLEAHKDAEAIAERQTQHNAGRRRQVNRHRGKHKMATGLGKQVVDLLLRSTSTN